MNHHPLELPLKQLQTYLLEASLNSRPNPSSSRSNSISTLSSSLDLCWLSTRSFISSIDFRSLCLRRDLRLYIMTIYPLEGTVCCISCWPSLSLRAVSSPMLSASSFSISSFRMWNISLFFIAYLFFRSSALLFFIAIPLGGHCPPFSLRSDRTFFFSSAFLEADVCARKRQSLSFILPSVMATSDFFSRFVDQTDSLMSYSSWICCKHTGLCQFPTSLLWGTITLIANLDRSLLRFSFPFPPIEFIKQYAIQQKHQILYKLIPLHRQLSQQCYLKGRNSVVFPDAIIKIKFSDMQNDSHRQLNDLGSESEDDLQLLFPAITTKELKQSIENLKANYERALHAKQLINYCYRCHHPAIRAAFLQFKTLHHPELEEPSISAFFSNQSFPDLNQLGLSLQHQQEYTGLHIAPLPKDLKAILDELFTNYGFIPNLERFLLYYPTYLQKHTLLKKSLFEGDKIDHKVAYFLAFCGAAEMSCTYMMVRYYSEFKAARGDLTWIHQGNYPLKYRPILELNTLLAKSVWQITEEFMSDLYYNSKNQWNQSEIAICLQILAYSHQNCTIALALGLKCEDSQQMNHILGLKEVQQLISQYRERQYTPSENKERLAVIVAQLNEQDTQRQSLTSIKKAVNKPESEEEVETYMKEIGQQLSKQQLNEQISLNLKPLLSQHRLVEKRKEHRFPTIDYSEFNFTFMAYPKLNNLTQSIADKILNLISYSETMSKDNLGSLKANTRQFRKAMRYYAENLCGYRHHEYDYKTNISLYLTLPLKFFVRLLTLSPVHINQHVIRQIHHESGQLECFDIGHIAVMVANTRMSLELSLATRALEID